MITNGCTVTVTRRTESGTDARGNATFDERSHELDAVALAPTSVGDVTGDGRDGSDFGFTLYHGDPDADLIASDVVTVAGADFDVLGHPQRWTNPLTGGRRGLVATLRRVEG